MTVAVCIGFAIAIFFVVRLATAWRAAIGEQRRTDPLTGLPNRLGFEAIVADHLRNGLPFGVVWMGIDGFRKLNELHGHGSGDLLLAQIGPRVRRCLRTGDAVARFGGDQFLVLLRGHDAIPGITGRILAVMNASAGVSLYPNHADTAPELLRLAETALRQAKATARGRVLSYDPSMAVNGFRGGEIASLIESALANDHFRLVYQPIVDENGEIARMEALVRIEDPLLGRVAPAEFIGVAEQTGLIHEVGKWILRRACRQARDWRDAGFPTQVTINMSPLQLASRALTDDILNEVSESGLGNSAIAVHITGVVQDADPVDQLRSAGVHVSSQRPQRGNHGGPLFDGVRVTAPFDIPYCPRALTVIAQGIEEPEQLDRARAAGCHLFQGFLIAPPLEPNDATEILRNGLFADAASVVRR
jgi:predicted signal transduction protein with EAL and GGDEF domain